MPAQKRSHEEVPSEEDESLQRNQNQNENHHKHPQDVCESYGSPSSGGGDNNEFVVVKLSEIRKEVQCPICLGIIRKTRTVMECLHRFCRECIDKSMRLGNNECPACRAHCASRRSLRDDPNYDALIAVLYPDIDKYEEQEWALYEEEKACNKQIQASIAQTFQRQSEALGRKRTTARVTAAAFVKRSQGNYRNLRGKRNHRAAELQGSDDDDDDDINGNDEGKDLSSADEFCTDIKPKRCKRWGGSRFSQPSSAAASADGGCDENDLEINRESVGACAGLVSSSERLAWGKGGMRSHTRHGGSSGGNGKNARNSRLSKLIDFLQNSEENDDRLDVHLMVVDLSEQRICNLQQPYLCCRPTLSVRHLCKILLHPEELEMWIVKKLHSKLNSSSSTSVAIAESSFIDLSKDELQILEEHETLAGFQVICDFSRGHLVISPLPTLLCSCTREHT
ncbi:putative E3 ubiquitin-protein ligase RING1a isoform X2 [Camellia sinensis]|uniref:putative E3 ubiquitin-protein ligase RING1a isoform X2 n=1 Tax=Camellia sinensis TaxID=4442 RepID=UPI001035CD82|nr:putative E3 ubiquitin-protein ligase RING1a isoform X2 [Camellia sinensis]